MTPARSVSGVVRVISATREQALLGREWGQRRCRSVSVYTRKCWPSGLTSYGVRLGPQGSRIAPRNNSGGGPASNRGPVVTLTATTSPSGVRSYSSCPSARHVGTPPPAGETRTGGGRDLEGRC